MSAVQVYLSQMVEQLNVIRRDKGEQWTLGQSGGDHTLVEKTRPGLVIVVASVRGAAFQIGAAKLPLDLTPAAMAVQAAREALPPLLAAFDIQARATALMLGCIKEAGHAIDDAREPLMIEAEASVGCVYLYVYTSNGDQVDPHPSQLVAKYIMTISPSEITSDDLDDSE